MKLIDRIRAVADSPEYVEFAVLWRGFQDTGRMKAGNAHRMLQLGNELMRRAAREGSEHAKAQVRGPFTLTQPQADQLILEAERGLSRCTRTALPELYAYAQFVDRAMHLTSTEAQRI